jgi:hypothetical protein
MRRPMASWRNLFPKIGSGLRNQIVRVLLVSLRCCLLRLEGAGFCLAGQGLWKVSFASSEFVEFILAFPYRVISMVDKGAFIISAA